MNFLGKIVRAFNALLAIPLYWIEKREVERKVNQRLKRLDY